METKFTKGEWSLNLNDTKTGDLYIRAAVYKDNPDVGTFPAICDVQTWPADRWAFLHRSEAEANAHLIAAAPLLYAALDELLGVCIEVVKGGETVNLESGHLQGAVAGLAKARGEV